MPRAWFISSDASELVQVQNDWFARNWRKVGAHPEYPRYPKLREPFARDFQEFVQHIEEAGLGPVEPTQCELTYINHIVTPNELPPSEILSIVRPQPVDDLPSPETIRIALRYVIQGASGPLGRLHGTVEPAIRRADGQPVTVLTLTARGRPLSKGIAGVLDFFDAGHDRLIRAFDLAGGFPGPAGTRRNRGDVGVRGRAPAPVGLERNECSGRAPRLWPHQPSGQRRSPARPPNRVSTGRNRRTPRTGPLPRRRQEDRGHPTPACQRVRDPGVTADSVTSPSGCAACSNPGARPGR